MWGILEKMAQRVLGLKGSGFDIVVCDDVEYDDDNDYDLFYS
jgi:hypothetical protein